MNYISADYIYPISSPPIKNGVLCVAADGSIVAVFTPQEAVANNVENVKTFKGVLVPGFVNTHCHLELSHLRNKIAEKTGLPTFIKQILSLRAQSEEEIISAMTVADQEMFNNGIVAVADISNLGISKAVKLNSKIYYHTLIEVLGFNSPVNSIIENAEALKQQFEPLKSSVVPHAPYSVSSALFEELNKITQSDDVLSIHNQETKGENELFEHGTGELANFFAEMNIAQSEAHNSGKNSLHYHLPKLYKEVNTLLVHNTEVSKADIDFAKTEHQKLFWCLCPNANLYIEDTLPDVDLLADKNLMLTLGTDSLASNHQLSILAEMKTLQDEKGISFGKSIKWATLNGAKFLGIHSQYGSFDIGKKPGIVLLELGEDLLIKNETKIKRIF